MKIVFFEVPQTEQEVLKQYFPDHEVSFYQDKLTEENVGLAEGAEVVSTFINSMISQTIIDKIPTLKYITTRSTGFDHIDLPYAHSKGIQVSNVPAYGSCTVAEFAFALLLNLSRKIHLANQELKENADFSIYTFRGFDLRDKVVGVIGTGKIGKNFIKMAKGFGMKVIAYDLYPDMNFATENSFEYKTLSEIFTQSDVISLHAPYTKENHHLINKENIATFKKGMYLINTARGELVDTDALVWALNEGIVAGAGLDVLEGERELKEEMEIISDPDKRDKVTDYKTLLEDRVLINMKNVIVTPHIAFYSKEAVEEIIKTTVENIKGFMNGTPNNILK
ncbi:MAG: NAD(P)-dependent oxidoreductase [Patescibacteria group bacterium]